MTTQKDTEEARAETSSLILDAAEAVFSDRGFYGATTRAIAETARVNLALIHYYFGSKDALFEAVFSRRALEINGERQRRLAEAMARPDRKIEDVLDAFLRPSITSGRRLNAAGHGYAKMLAHGATGSDERSRGLTARHFDGIAREFIAAIETVMPHLGHGAAARCYLYATSISISLMSDTGRIAILSDGACVEDDLETVIGQAVRFVAAGMVAFQS